MGSLGINSSNTKGAAFRGGFCFGGAAFCVACVAVVPVVLPPPLVLLVVGAVLGAILIAVGGRATTEVPPAALVAAAPEDCGIIIGACMNFSAIDSPPHVLGPRNLRF